MDPFVGEIRMFAGNFAPRGWAFCNGQLLSVSQNDALFSLLGTIYGGDGRSTFGLPDLRGRVAIHQGTGPGLTPRRLGQKSGEERVNVAVAELPEHTHSTASTASATLGNPGGHRVADTGTKKLYNDGSTEADLVLASSAASQNVGGSQSHNNMMPFLGINYIIALFGVYPSRS